MKHEWLKSAEYKRQDRAAAGEIPPCSGVINAAELLGFCWSDYASGINILSVDAVNIFCYLVVMRCLS